MRNSARYIHCLVRGAEEAAAEARGRTEPSTGRATGKLVQQIGTCATTGANGI